MSTEQSDRIYHGFQAPGGSLVTVETPAGEVIGPLRHVVLRSPSGFSWGYAGSGPAELARCLLLDALGDHAICPACNGTGKIVLGSGDDDTIPYDPDHANEYNPELVMGCLDCDDGYRRIPYQDFKFQVVATLPEQEWRIDRRKILTWLADQGFDID